MNKFNFLKIEPRGPALWIYFDRTDVRNALSLEMAEELLRAVRWGVRQKEFPVLVLSGKGGSFSAGGDIKGMSQTKNQKKFFLDISRVVHAAVVEIRRTEKMVLAAAPGFVGGVALGLFLSTDLRIASDQARFNAATIRLGLVANGGTTWFLPRIAGLARAAEVLFLGDVLSADEALKIGIVHRVVPSGELAGKLAGGLARELERQTQEIAERLAAGPRAALGRLKKILNQSLTSTLPAQLERERQAIAWSSTTADFQEGIQAFLEKRTPSFNRSTKR